jgi:hypothetical protein
MLESDTSATTMPSGQLLFLFFLHALHLHGDPAWLACGHEMLESDPSATITPGGQLLK